MIFVVGLPAPWPALVSIRIKVGLSQPRSEFKAVRGHDAVVVIGGRDHCRRIAAAFRDVMQR